MFISFNEGLTPREAIAEQKLLRTHVCLEPLAAKPRLIGGADVSMNRFAKEGFGGIVTLDADSLAMVDHSVVESLIPFPYVPGLLSYREIPMLVKAWELLKTKPDVLVVDGIGIAHPRRLGIASHFGIILDIPTIGCAKSVLTGIYEEPGLEAGSISYLHDKNDPTDIIGAAVRTKKNVKPIFVSPGHRITLEESIKLLLSCVRGYRLPEPTRVAHNTVNEFRIAAMKNQTKIIL